MLKKGAVFMEQAGILIPVICAVLAAMILTYLFANGRRCRTTDSYMLCITLILFWNIAEIPLLMADNIEQEMLALKVKFLPVVYLGVSWLYFCLTIANCKILNSRIFKIAIILFPAVCYVFLLTNEHHHLFFREGAFITRPLKGEVLGPVFWIHVVESYLCIITGTVIIIKNLRKAGRKFSNYILLILSLLLPLAANILILAGIIPYRRFDVTAQAILLTLVIFGIAVYRKKFLNLIPVAARHFIENMSDGIVIIDNDNVVVGLNDAINEAFPGLNLNIYDPARKLLDFIRDNSTGGMRDTIVDILESGSGNCCVKGRLEINGVDFYVETGILTDFNGSCCGRMVIFEDRREEQQLLNEIKNKNIQLTNINERLIEANKMLTEANYRLEEYSKTAEELAVTRERNRMGREVHDTVGHTLTLLIALTENVKSRLEGRQEDLKCILDKGIEISRQALNDIRIYLKGLHEESFENTNLVDLLNDLMNNHLSSGTRIEVSISENLPAIDAVRAMAVYRICQEAVTNAIRHGQAKTVNIIIKGHPEGIRLYIFDDGKGCDELVKGYGLTGMEERVAKLGGNITFGSDGEKGFNIVANLPV